jgi:hypothetical protein
LNVVTVRVLARRAPFLPRQGTASSHLSRRRGRPPPSSPGSLSSPPPSSGLSGSGAQTDSVSSPSRSRSASRRFRWARTRRPCRALAVPSGRRFGRLGRLGGSRGRDLHGGSGFTQRTARQRERSERQGHRQREPSHAERDDLQDVLHGASVRTRDGGGRGRPASSSCGAPPRRAGCCGHRFSSKKSSRSANQACAPVGRPLLPGRDAMMGPGVCRVGTRTRSDRAHPGSCVISSVRSSWHSRSMPACPRRRRHALPPGVPASLVERRQIVVQPLNARLPPSRRPCTERHQRLAVSLTRLPNRVSGGSAFSSRLNGANRAPHGRRRPAPGARPRSATPRGTPGRSRAPPRSVSRTLVVRCRQRGRSEPDLHARTAAFGVLQRERAAPSLGQVARDRQAQARTAGGSGDPR